MTIRAFGALLCGGLLMLATAAFARDGDPLPGIDVSMEQNPGGIIIATGTTNGSGDYVFTNMPEGNYTLRVKSGPDKGKILKTITVKKNHGPVSGKLVAKGAGAAAK
jgi:hypothetical protein